ncbi:flippase [Arthrobacter sp. ZXY-2]|nr:flippase [Arthrobacter sp. ZXY-2]
MKSSPVVNNGSWDAGQQLVTTLANAVVTFLLVTVVSVSDYGMFSYAVALSSLGTAVMSAGLSGLAVKKLVEDRAANAAIISSLLLARELFALAGYVLVILISLSSNDFPTILATALAAVSLFGRGLEAPDMWYLSKLRSRRTAVVRGASTLVLLAVRLTVLALVPNIWIFLGLFALEPLIVSLLIIIRYCREMDSPGLAYEGFKRAKNLLRESLPLMLSGLANQINLKADIVALQALQGNVSVAIYSLAARLSELTHFFPVIFMNSLLPGVLETRKVHGPKSRRYLNRLYRAYLRAFWLGVSISVCVAIAGWLLIPLMFGNQYAESVLILTIHVCATPFVFMAAVYSKWIIAEGILWVSLVRHGAGAALNVVLCMILIPLFGGVGAALATVVSYTAASYLSCFLGRSTRGQGILMSRAIFAPWLYLWANLIHMLGHTKRHQGEP